MKKTIFLALFIFALFISANAAEGDYIIRYRSDVPRFYSAESENSLGAGMYLVSAEKALALMEAGMLEICEPDRLMTYYDAPVNDNFYSLQYNIPMIKAPYAWSLHTYGNDVRVGVIDSGLALNHPDIDYSRVETGYNFGAIPTDNDYLTNRLDWSDKSGHGTMVSGAIIAKRNNSVGIAGISDMVKLVVLKVENKLGSIYSSSVISAINVGAGYGCDILNISLGMGTDNPDLKAAIDNALAQGCIVVCAAGNDTEEDPGDHPRYPAAYPGVISVASVNQSYSHVESSVVNESVHISAPATGIPLLHYEGEYVYASGTSFAAPQVTAAAAIAKSIDPTLTPKEFAELLKNSAYRPDAAEGDAPTRNNEIGYGTLDIEKMIKLMLTGRNTYVSPLDSLESVSVFNLTDSEISLTSIFAAYSGNAMADYSISPVTIPVNGYYTHQFSTTESYGNLRHFLWDSMENIAPYEKNYTSRELIR